MSSYYDFKEMECNKFVERKRILLCLIAAHVKKLGLHNTYEELLKETHLSTDLEVCDNIDLEIILQEFQSFYFMKYNRDAKIVRIVSDDNKLTKVQNKKKAKKIIKENSLDQKSDLILNVKSLIQTNDEFENLILKDMFPIPSNSTMKWVDCVGLQTEIEALKEAVIYPLRFPKIFADFLGSWKGVLLYGPPGCGKTHLMKTLASESKLPVFEVAASSIISKWRGESEKLLKAVFDTAKFNAPSIIFIDEIDALASHRDTDTQHEASKRFKSELLLNMDSMCDNVVIVGATNLPWDIDVAVLRRFDKHILVNIPSIEIRAQLFEKFLNCINVSSKENEYKTFAKLSTNFNVSDIKNACKELQMKHFRQHVLQLSQAVNYELLWQSLKGPLASEMCTILEAITPTVPKQMLKKYDTWKLY